MATFVGRKLRVTIEGESHSPTMTVRVQGMPTFAYDQDALAAFLARRKPAAASGGTARQEADVPIFDGMDGNLISADWRATIVNANTRSHDYDNLYGKPRPGHADYAWYCKDGALDFSGGGRFSGRLTAPLAVVGGLCKQYMHHRGIDIYTYVAAIGQAKGKSYRDADFCLSDLQGLVYDDLTALAGQDAMRRQIQEAKAQGDSVGGIAECVVTGLPAGIGDNLFEGLEGKIAQLVYAVPAVKGVAFGAGFALAAMTGSQANDGLYYQNEEVCFATNHMGGINGGISNGNYLSLAVAVKPTPSIAKPQQTVDLAQRVNTTIAVSGRHDACIVPRALPAIESAVAIALVDELA